MSDIIEDDFDYDKFSIFALAMLKKGTCAKLECPDYRHYEGPQASNDSCRKCCKERTR